MKSIAYATALSLLLLSSAAYAQTSTTAPAAHPRSATETPTASAPQQSEGKVYTQKDMDAYVCNDAGKAGIEMNDLYNQIQKKYEYDQVFVKRLQEAQKAWGAYRDAEMQAVYPPEYAHSYGSMAASCGCQEVAVIIKERIKELKKWMDVPKAGAACTGTRTGGKK